MHCDHVKPLGGQPFIHSGHNVRGCFKCTCLGASMVAVNLVWEMWCFKFKLAAKFCHTNPGACAKFPAGKPTPEPPPPLRATMSVRTGFVHSLPCVTLCLRWTHLWSTGAGAGGPALPCRSPCIVTWGITRLTNSQKWPPVCSFQKHHQQMCPKSTLGRSSTDTSENVANQSAVVLQASRYPLDMVVAPQWHATHVLVSVVVGQCYVGRVWGPVEQTSTAVPPVPRYTPYHRPIMFPACTCLSYPAPPLRKHCLV